MKTGRSTLVAAWAWWAACTGTEGPAQPPERAQESAPEPAPAPAPAEEKAPEPPDEPPLPLTFAPVIEGQCRGLGVSAASGEVFVHHGSAEGPFFSSVYLARAPAGGMLEEIPFAVEDPGGDSYVTVGRVDRIEGTWPDDLWMRYLQVDGRVWEGHRYLKRKDGKWRPIQRRNSPHAGPSGVERLYPWTDGNVLGRMECNDYDTCVESGLNLQVVRGPGKAPKFPELRPPKTDSWCPQRYEMAVLPGGEIFAVGRFCHKEADSEEKDWYAVRWSPTGGTAIDKLPRQGGDRITPGPVVALSPTQVWAGATFHPKVDSTVVMAWDGKEWKALPTVAGGLRGLEADRAGALWLLAGDTLQRSKGGGPWESVAFPTGRVEQIGGMTDEVGWVTQTDGTLWLRPAGQEFVRVELPPPAFSLTASFKAESVRTNGRDVWVLASYTEKPPGWQKKESRSALLRNAAVAQTQRCGEDHNFSPQKGLYAWPAAAREGCTTIYAVLHRASSWAPKDAKFPEIGKAIKGRDDLAAVKFSEAEIGGIRVAGATVPDLAVGRALVELYAGKNKKARPELLCTTPKEIRPLAYDLKTGKPAP